MPSHSPLRQLDFCRGRINKGDPLPPPSPKVRSNQQKQQQQQQKQKQKQQQQQDEEGEYSRSLDAYDIPLSRCTRGPPNNGVGWRYVEIIECRSINWISLEGTHGRNWRWDPADGRLYVRIGAWVPGPVGFVQAGLDIARKVLGTREGVVD